MTKRNKSPRQAAVRKKKYRRWLRKRGLPITKWHYTNCILPDAA